MVRLDGRFALSWNAGQPAGIEINSNQKSTKTDTSCNVCMCPAMPSALGPSDTRAASLLDRLLVPAHFAHTTPIFDGGSGISSTPQGSSVRRREEVQECTSSFVGALRSRAD